MSYIDRPLSAIERARAAYEELMQRQRAVAQERQARARTRKVTLLVSLGTLVTVLSGVVIYNGWIPEGVRSTLLGSSSASRYDNSRTGQVRTMVQGNTCQELKFSNDSGSFVSGNLVSCETTVIKAPPVPSTAGSRVNSIRDAFTR
jgi:hypothetical protein